MGLTLLGQIRTPAELTRRRRGKTAAALWNAYQPQYFEGTNAEELAQIIAAAGAEEIGVSWAWGGCAELTRQVTDGIQEGNIAVIGWQSRSGRYDHWVLAVGIEGQKRAGVFRPTALLCLDPGETAPTLSAYNARIELGSKPQGKRGVYLRYVTPRKALEICLNEVVWMTAA